MTNRNFDEWLSKFRPSISSYDYYIDFEKVVRNVEEIKVELNILNSLIGSKSIEEDFEKIVTKYPETLQCIPLLLAVRGNEIYAQDEEGAFLYNFKKMNYSVEQYKVFMRKTGLFDMIANHLVNNLVDYALGIETGLDSNGRKNRGGHQMEDLVEKYIVAAGFEKDVNYFKEMYLKDIEERINPYNLQIGMKIEICPGREYTRPEMPGNTGDSGISNNNGKGNLKELMRMAWLNHTYLLRMLLVSMAADLPDQQELVTALIDNAEEIADLFGRYYPENTVNSLRDLLVRQVELTGGLITQKKEGRTKDTVEQVRRLNENADRIAELLASATPEYEESVLKEMFRMHVDLTGQEISERLAGNYEKDLQTFWNIQRQIIAMADYFANGLETEAKESGLR